MDIFLIELSVWMLLSIFATFIAFSLKAPITLTEIIVGVLAYQIISLSNYPILHLKSAWINVVTTIGALSLNFLAGLELNTDALQEKWKENAIIGLVSFLAPCGICFLFAYYSLNWSSKASLLAGVALSTTSIAIVKMVVTESKLNKNFLGKRIFAISLITNLYSMLALLLVFLPLLRAFNSTFVISLVIFVLMLLIYKPIIKHSVNKSFEFSIKYIFLCLSVLAAFATFSGSEAIVFSYFLGVAMANFLKNKNNMVKNFRVIVTRFLAPFCFIKVGMLISVPILLSVPMVIGIFFVLKMLAKTVSIYFVSRAFKYTQKQSLLTCTLLSPGLALGGTITILGLFHGILTSSQYTIIISAIVLSSLIPVLISKKIDINKKIELSCD
jgi:Kef-type K+ transport system membrane component KefB